MFFSRDSIVWWYVAKPAFSASLSNSAFLHFRTAAQFAVPAAGARPHCSLELPQMSHDSYRCLSRHWLVRKRQAALYAIDGIHIGGKVRRIGGWGGELAAWKRDVKALLESAME